MNQPWRKAPLIRNLVPYTGTVPVRLGLHIGHKFSQEIEGKGQTCTEY